jgi:hypothetical protein
MEFIAQTNSDREMKLAEWLENGDCFVNETEVKDDFVPAVFMDINQKLDIIMKRQEELLRNIRITARGGR